MHPYNYEIRYFDSKSPIELYFKLKFLARIKMGVKEMPFSLTALVHPPSNKRCPEVIAFMEQVINSSKGDTSEEQAIKLIKHPKENPPPESYENPPKKNEDNYTTDEKNLMSYIFKFGIDLPGSKHNLFGHLQHYTSFFIDMLFGNYTEFIGYTRSLSKVELKKALRRREGHCQFSPIFSPILGLALIDIKGNIFLTIKEKQEFRTMYNGCNENRHIKILKKLIKLGADVNAHDINGYTPLLYAVKFKHEETITVLLKHGADPNEASIDGWTPLRHMLNTTCDSGFRCIDVLIQYNAKMNVKKEADYLRNLVELNATKELAVKVREAHPRDKGECEKCLKPSVKKCSACGLVYYCTPACQKIDWKFHKITCNKSNIKKKIAIL